MSGKFFDYGTGSKPKFARKKRSKTKRPRDSKAAARKAAETRRRKKFNKNFDYGLGNVFSVPEQIGNAFEKIILGRVKK